MQTALSIANHFIETSPSHGCNDLTPMKLQKLVYFAHGWHLGIVGEPLFNEGVQAWQYGPVVYSVYREFKHLGGNPIKEPAVEVFFDGTELHTFSPNIGDDEQTKSLIDRMWELYGKYTPSQLSTMTHAAGTPWQQVASKFPDDLPRGLTIPNELLKQYFESQVPERV